MSKYLIGLLLLSLSAQLKAQNVTGKVVDKNTGEAIAFASVGVVGKNEATVSNESGEFVLKITSFPAKIRCSHVSYLITELETNSLEELEFKLTPATIMLSQVVVDPYAGQRIVRKALEKAGENADKNFYGNAFYRQLTSVDGQPSQIYELFYDLRLNVKRITGWVAKQSRFAELNQQYSFSMNNQSYVTFSYAGYLYPEKGGNFVNLKNFKNYTFELIKTIEQKDQQVAMVSCKYKGKKKKQYFVNSVFYVGVDDAKIYRVENSVFNLPMRFTNATSNFPIIFSTVATFKVENNPVAVLESVATKMFVKVDINGRNISSSINSLLTVYKLDQSLGNQQYNALTRETIDKNVVESIAYNPDFWRNNPIVKQTSLEDAFIKMMESQSAFGTMTNQ